MNDIPKKRIDEIMKKCTITTTKELIKLIKHGNLGI